MAGGDQLGRDGAAEESASPGDEHDHGATGLPPARMRSAHSDSRDRSIFELCRMSVGSRGTASTATSGMPVLSRTAPVKPGFGEAGAGGRGQRLDDRDGLAQSVRADADDGGAADRVDALDLLLGPDGRDRSVGCDDHVRHPTLDPQAAEIVEVPDIAGAMPPAADGAGAPLRRRCRAARRGR